MQRGIASTDTHAKVTTLQRYTNTFIITVISTKSRRRHIWLLFTAKW